MTAGSKKSICWPSPPRGFLLIEIKSRPGQIRGDAGTWTWEAPDKPPATVNNPLLSCQREGFTQHELGPALIFERHSGAIRLDHFLSQQAAHLSFDRRVDLVPQIADVVRFAQEKRVVHRALCPQSVLVVPRGDARKPVSPSPSPKIAGKEGTNEDVGRRAYDTGAIGARETDARQTETGVPDTTASDPGWQVKLFNWQLGFRGGRRCPTPFTKIKEIREEVLAQNGLQGSYNARFASLFAMTNLGYSERKDSKANMQKDGAKELADEILGNQEDEENG